MSDNNKSNEKTEDFLNEARDDIDSWFDYNTEKIKWSIKKRIDSYFDSVKNVDLHMRLYDLQEELTELKEELTELKEDEVKERMKEILDDLIDDLKEDLKEKIKI